MENEIPWVVPEAIDYIYNRCSPASRALDIGTGGSTVFYARHCARVTAIETNAAWFARVQKYLDEKRLTNVEYLLIQDPRQIEDYLLVHGGFDLVSVDTVHGYSRSAFLEAVWIANRTMSTLVLDNYASPELFPMHHDKSMVAIAAKCPGAGWVGKDFDDGHWHGRGTRVLHR